MKWLADPRWSRNHHKLCSISSVVTARGRLFYIMDQASAANINLPGKWLIVARDAFNGIELWRKPMASWAWHEIRFRSGPPQVTRLLVASGDRLYAPLQLNAPVSVMDAATGRTLHTCDDTAGAEEIVLSGQTLLVLKGSPVAEHAVKHRLFRDAFEMPNHKAVVAIDVKTARTLWQWSDPKMHPVPETLATDGERAYVQVGEGVVCVEMSSGDRLWAAGNWKTNQGRGKVTYGKNTLVVSDGAVLCKLQEKLTAFAADTGAKLWDCEAGGGFHSPVDVFVIDGLVWQGLHVSDSISPPPVDDFSEGRDLHTGAVKVTNTVMVDLQTEGHHHRCYREKATVRYIIAGKRGVEMMDLAGDDHSRNNWVRGACQYGILPANGLIYAPPHACGCYMESKLRGFWALSAHGTDHERVPDDRRLEKGPAYGHRIVSAGDQGDAWPQYRHDALRSGVAGTTVSQPLRPAWQTRIGPYLTPPVVAEEKVLVGAANEGAVYALDASTGDVTWRFVAGGRVDSPPAIFDGRVLFGSADGRVYCLRLSDGALIWRFLAAPTDLRTVSENRLESLWPVHGSVLVLDALAYCSAGRSTWLDGGIDLYALDPATGAVEHRTHFQSRHPGYREGRDKARSEHGTRVDQNKTDYKTFLASDRSDAFSMAEGCVSDVLVSDGRDVFLHHARFDAQLKPQARLKRHLFSTSSLLDDAENHRSHWVLGTGDFSRLPVAYSWIVNRPGKRTPTIAVPTGVLMVYDDRAVWGVRRKGDANGQYCLFQKANAPFAEDDPSLPDFRNIPPDKVDRCVWKRDLPVRTKAMLKSGDYLLMGVMAVEIPERDPHAAYENRRGGGLWVVRVQDGECVGKYELDAPVIWDGLAAAHRQLFVVTADGSVACWGPASLASTSGGQVSSVAQSGLE
jgi:outer membrane protein assembly factor BamB